MPPCDSGKQEKATGGESDGESDGKKKKKKKKQQHSKKTEYTKTTEQQPNEDNDLRYAAKLRANS